MNLPLPPELFGDDPAVTVHAADHGQVLLATVATAQGSYLVYSPDETDRGEWIYIAAVLSGGAVDPGDPDSVARLMESPPGPLHSWIDADDGTTQLTEIDAVPPHWLPRRR